jgi:very-short-patch-repair endonuclease
MDRIEIARRFRRADTRAETILWEMLRGRRLGGFKFRRQVPIDRYFADFVCLDARLIVELDGPSHHAAVEQDAVRIRRLEVLGYLVIRVRNQHLYETRTGVADAILAALKLARP